MSRVVTESDTGIGTDIVQVPRDLGWDSLSHPLLGSCKGEGWSRVIWETLSALGVLRPTTSKKGGFLLFISQGRG